MEIPSTETMHQALAAIAAMWPENRPSSQLENVAGMNDGRARGITAHFAVKMARAALGLADPAP